MKDELEDLQEIVGRLKSEVVEAYLSSFQWPADVSEREKLIAVETVRAFAAWSRFSFE